MEHELRECPRCHKHTMLDTAAHNSVSHMGNKIEICNFCENEEMMIECGFTEYLPDPSGALGRSNTFREILGITEEI